MWTEVILDSREVLSVAFSRVLLLGNRVKLGGEVLPKQGMRGLIWPVEVEVSGEQWLASGFNGK